MFPMIELPAPLPHRCGLVWSEPFILYAAEGLRPTPSQPRPPAMLPRLKTGSPPFPLLAGSRPGSWNSPCYRPRVSDPEDPPASPLLRRRSPPCRAAYRERIDMAMDAAEAV